MTTKEIIRIARQITWGDVLAAAFFGFVGCGFVVILPLVLA